MRYEKIREGKFIRRPNRFVAEVEIDGEIQKVHVKNTGRCHELLKPGVRVYLEDFKESMTGRKMRYSLVTVEKNSIDLANPLVNMDSQMPNKAVGEYFKKFLYRGPGENSYGEGPLEGLSLLKKIRPEFTYGNSRIDFLVEDIKGVRALVEVKGVTLEKTGRSYFPDAPTERGIKHLLELEKALNEGYGAYVLFLVQMKGVKSFSPNDETHEAFGNTLRRVIDRGVKIAAFDSLVSPWEVILDERVKIML